MTDCQQQSKRLSVEKGLHRSAFKLMLWHWTGAVVAGGTLWHWDLIGDLWRWMVMAGGLMIWAHFQLWSHIHQNHPPDRCKRYPVLGIANQITMIRGWGISIMAGFIFSDPLTPGDSKAIAWLVGIVYLMVAGADVLDGLWARRTRTETLLGQTMDTEMDALGLLIAAALAVKLGHLPFWYLSVGLSYYVYQLGLWHHKRRRKAIYPLKARPFRRVIAGIQMGFVGAGLLPIFDAGALQVAAICFSLPFLAGFLWDWKTVSGGLHQVSEERWIIFFNKLAGVLPLFLRSVLLVGGMLVSKGFLAAEMLAWLHGLWWILWGLMVSGCLGRLAACGMSFLLALRPAMVGDPLVLMVLMGGTTGLVMLGTGKGSIWQPENRFFDGELGAAGSVSAPDRINREHQLLRH